MDLLDAFRPLLDAARGLDLTDAAAAEATLEARFPADGAAAREFNDTLRRLYAEGAVAHKGAPPMTWSRVARPGPETDGHSIDVVFMTGPGPRHRHPKGEIDWCVAMEGEPTFDGRPPGWVVCEAGSVHVPTTAGGAMLVVYLLPEGAFELVEATA